MKTIQVIIEADGKTKIDAIGFTGMDCVKATQFLEQALGVKADSKKKPEYYQQQKRQANK